MAVGGFAVKASSDVIGQLDLLAHLILTSAKKKVPVRTGALRASGRVQKKGKSTRLIGFGGSGTGVNYAALVEYGGSAASPRPFLRPAFYEVKASFKKSQIVKEMTLSWTVAAALGSSYN